MENLLVRVLLAISMTSIIIIFSVLYVFLVQELVKWRRKNKYFKVLLKYLEISSTISLEETVILFKGTTYHSQSVLNKWLQEFLIKLVSDKSYTTADETTLKTWKQNILEIIKQNEQIVPFSELPDSERCILIDLYNFVERKEFDLIKPKLDELVGVIKTRHEEYKKSAKLNKLSVPIGIVGIIVSVIIGIFPFVSMHK